MHIVKRRKPQDVKERFEKYVFPEPNTGCWLWGAAFDSYGYGIFKMGEECIKTHRASWKIYRGEIPKGLCVLHKCDTPACVNPDHLFLGTRKDNNDDKLKKGRWGGGIGSSQWQSVFTESEVLRIRNMNLPIAKIAKKYNVNQTTIYRIKNKETWKHI